MAEAIVSVVLEQLAKVACGQTQQEVKLVKGVDDEIKKLTSNFQAIQAVLADAEQRHVKEAAVADWLKKLKDVSYDTEDVLDQWNTTILRSLQPEGAENARSIKRKVCSCFLFPYSGLKQVVLSHDIASKIKAINDNLDAIAKEKDGYNLKITTTPTSVELTLPIASTPIVDESEVVGLEEQKNDLVAKLVDESCEEGIGLHIISIVGMGGIGKTTLAQLAYNSREMMSYFDKRIWVCVSDPFDPLRIAKAILEYLEGHDSGLSMLQSFLQKISESLRRKRFLIVLDDVWTENYRDWEPFHHCLKNGLHGSKVLVTTRKQKTALMMNSIDIISIEGLSIEHCWSLFRHLAFFGRSDEECEKLEGISREIVSKCKGLPVAVKTMGSLLRLKKTREEWESILYSDDMFKEESTPFVDVSEVVESPHQREESTSFVGVSEVVGLEEQKKDLVAKLFDQSCEEGNGLHIISIVGMRGIGKTTLAQLAYNSCEVMNNFEKRIWVCVSDPFDPLRIAKAILEDLEGHASNLLLLQSFLQKISESLRSKRFLIVLDDVWTENYRDWEPFHHCLKNGLHGSRVLVTTRKQPTALMMNSIETISIEGLSEEHCWSLFRQFAFFGRSDEECKELEGIGREIVSKCNSLPLAVKTMGSLLRFKRTKEEWKNILDSEMWELRESENIIFQPLLLSYYDLLPMVKQCFTYCAMFPKDFLFQKDELIKLWMAQGYLKLTHNKELEIIGEECFNSLAMRSFFQEFKKDDDGRNIRCKMPNIVHEVAQRLSKNECCITEAKSVEENINAFCKTARQLRFMAARRVSRDTLPISICNFKKLRILLTDGDLYASNKVLRKIFDELTCLKALGISGSGTSFKRIPKEIGKLIHLRYLDLSNSEKLRKLPETVCELFNLQTLKLGGCSNLKELPQRIGKLINLRHLMNLDTDSLRYMPKGMERLIHLRTLNEFHLNGGDYGGKACSLEYFLNNFRHIESLWIKGLAKGIEETIAQLKNNDNIRALGLGFSGSFIRSDSTYKDDEAILESFQPPPNLQVLTIKYYFGPTMSTLRKMTSLTKLMSITLSDCRKCSHMPPLGKLPYLETLVIEWMTSVREVGNEFLGVESGEASSSSSSSSSIIYFPKLKTLRFMDMYYWEVWDFGNEDATCTIMPSLRSLQIHHCYKLKGLPKQLLQMAQLPWENGPLQLEIYNCYILAQLYSKRKGANIQIGWR